MSHQRRKQAVDSASLYDYRGVVFERPKERETLNASNRRFPFRGTTIVPHKSVELVGAALLFRGFQEKHRKSSDIVFPRTMFTIQMASRSTLRVRSLGIWLGCVTVDTLCLCQTRTCAVHDSTIGVVWAQA